MTVQELDLSRPGQQLPGVGQDPDRSRSGEEDRCRSAEGPQLRQDQPARSEAQAGRHGPEPRHGSGRRPDRRRRPCPMTTTIWMKRTMRTAKAEARPARRMKSDLKLSDCRFEMHSNLQSELADSQLGVPMSSHMIRGRQLSRDTEHRIAMRRNLVQSLFEHGKVRTTLPKAQEVKAFAEKLITLARTGTLNARRRVIAAHCTIAGWSTRTRNSSKRARRAHRAEAVQRHRPGVRRSPGRLHPHHQDRQAPHRRRRRASSRFSC